MPSQLSIDAVEVEPPECQPIGTVAIARPIARKNGVCRPHITPLCVYESRRGP